MKFNWPGGDKNCLYIIVKNQDEFFFLKKND
jgi:hypothetical protein